MRDHEAKALTVMVGAFPPPVGGAAKNNLLLLEELARRNVRVTAINVGAKTLSHNRSLVFHVQRIARNLLGMGRLVGAAQRGARLYMVPDGGLGAWYSMAHLLAARLLPYDRFVIHHRTFRYIDVSSRPIAILTRATQSRATHVFLSPEMSRRYQDRYGTVDSMIAGNARFVVEEAAAPTAPRVAGPLRIGHLSNLCREKGFFEVADAYEAFRAAGGEAQFHLAGPIVEPQVGARIESLKARYGDMVRHVGPVSGDTKIAFYRGVDVFLFPTCFDQEASPNVVYEALAAGVPVVATARGCIPEMIRGRRGLVTSSADGFASAAVAFMAALPIDEGAALKRARAIKADLKADCAVALRQHDALLGRLGVERA